MVGLLIEPRERESCGGFLEEDGANRELEIESVTSLTYFRKRDETADTLPSC